LRESTRHNDEAIRRYQALLKQFPDFPRAHAARYGLGLAHFRKGEQELASKTLEAIPAADRVGDLVGVHYDLAGIYLRQLPTRADDAVSAGKLEEKLKSASEMLESFLAAAPENPLASDALLKLGYCQHRIGGLLANPEEKQKALANARAALEKIQQKNREHPAFAAATLERAKVMVSQKDVDGGIRELQRFVAEEPLKKSPLAPMALVQLASLLRSRNRAAEAVTVLAECRKNYEAALAGDPERAGWAVRLPFHHAQALRETGKFAEAQQLFEQAARSERPEGWEAGLRAELARREAGSLKLADAARQLKQPGLKPEQTASLEKLQSEGLEMLRQAALQLASREKTLRDRKVDQEELQRELVQTRVRMLYESAWTWRMVADQELDAARRKREKERVEKRREELARMLPAGQPPPAVPVPEITVQELPVQPAEEQSKARYEEMIQALPEQPLTMEARFELAEMLSRRNRHDEAVKLLQTTLEGEKEPSPELAEKIRLRLASCLLERGAARKLASAKPGPGVAEQARKDIEAALEQLQPITANEKSVLLGQALYREGECQLHLDQLDEAIKKLSRFRDQQPLQNLPGISDRALLRLGWALGEKAQWEASRVAYETLLQRFPASPWRHEARYGVAWSLQKQGRLDEAINQYAQVTSAVANEMGARAQLNIGQCRLAQKRYNEASTALLVVPFTYDYPELNALALVEAARSLLEDKQKDQAVRLLRRVLRDHAGSAQADAARKKLLELGEGVEG
ncbi:MAG: tetratricopeptide repeat protein, partial [Gemmataceae bacterium]